MDQWMAPGKHFPWFGVQGVYNSSRQKYTNNIPPHR